MDTAQILPMSQSLPGKNDFGIAHTQSKSLRLPNRAFRVNQEFEELAFTAIIFHDIGGCTIKDQYEEKRTQNSNQQSQAWLPRPIHQAGLRISTTVNNPLALLNSSRFVMIRTS